MKYLLVGLMLGLFLIVLFSGCVTTNSIDTSTTNVNSLQINDCYHGKSYGVEGYNVDCVINSISNYNDCYSLSKIIKSKVYYNENYVDKVKTDYFSEQDIFTCTNKFLVKSKDPTYCEGQINFNGKSYYPNCLRNAGKFDVNVCSLYEKDNFDFTSCFTELATRDKTTNYCEYISDATKKIDCAQKVRIEFEKSGDLFSCELLKEPLSLGDVTACMDGAFITLEQKKFKDTNTDYCDLFDNYDIFKNQNKRSFCYYRLAQNGIIGKTECKDLKGNYGMCYEGVAQYKNDITICKDIIDQQGQSNCILYFTNKFKETKDLVGCKIITQISQDQAQTCMSQVWEIIGQNRYEGVTEEGCQTLSYNSSYKEKCYFELAKVTLNKSFCNDSGSYKEDCIKTLQIIS